MLSRMFGNWWTTLLGFLGGVVQYLATAGATPPATRAEWTSLLFSAILFALGLAAKDARTGSAPK